MGTTASHEHEFHINTDALSDYELRDLGVDILNALHDRDLLLIAVPTGPMSDSYVEPDQVEDIHGSDQDARITIRIVHDRFVDAAPGKGR
jgi:hypothetical protein